MCHDRVMAYLWIVLGFGCLAAATAVALLRERRGWSPPATLTYAAALMALGLVILLWVRYL
ncbi:hypothetical protein GCM10025862_26820 [Arsenicicoccus piscis]|uniref:Uncharacterized protein n=2 Tax=Arsenicicoccus piscis TaxID=673954 RepID=A0ABQ6HQL1_9MICO|nr:hypothetical protein GCM10025862_26820 [Arsenicicoccus piscis]